MISVSKFKANFLALFRLMRDTGMYVDVHNRGEVYRIHVEKMNQRVKYRTNKRSYAGEIQADQCPDCSKLMLNGVCMNPKCPTSGK